MPRFVLFVVLILALVGMACDRIAPDPDLLHEAKQATLQQDWTQAVRFLQLYLRDEEDLESRWQAWNLLIKAFTALGERGWTLDCLETMHREFEQDLGKTAQILAGLADFHTRSRNWNKAAEIWRQQLRIGGLPPAEAAALYRRLGIYEQQRNQWEAAENMFLMCRDKAETPDLYGDCLFYLADVAADQGDFEAARELLSRLLLMSDSPSALLGRAYMLLGDICQRQGDKAGALEAWESALPLYPNSPAVKSRIDFLQNSKGK